MTRGILGRVFEVHPDKMFGQAAVIGFVDSVEDKVDEIESRQQSWRQIDVLRDWEVDVVF